VDPTRKGGGPGSGRRIDVVSERLYEILFIGDPTLGEPEMEALVEQVQGYIEKEGGRIERVEKWGKKRLAYVVKKHREGYYVLCVVGGGGAMLREVERRLRVTVGVIKFISVRVDEDLRKAEACKVRRTAEEQKKRARQAARTATASAQEGVQS
jgi:small subunit ribosomal protein S6